MEAKQKVRPRISSFLFCLLLFCLIAYCTNCRNLHAHSNLFDYVNSLQGASPMIYDSPDGQFEWRFNLISFKKSWNKIDLSYETEQIAQKDIIFTDQVSHKHMSITKGKTDRRQGHYVYYLFKDELYEIGKGSKILLIKGPISASNKWTAKNKVWSSLGHAVDDIENCSSTDVYYNKEFQKNCFAITCQRADDVPPYKSNKKVSFCYSMGMVEMANNEDILLSAKKKL